MRALHQAAGNQAMHRHFVQAQLTISQADDPFEVEADRVADTVMRMPAAAGLPSISPVDNRLQRLCKSCEEEQWLQRKEKTSAGESVPFNGAAPGATSSGGAPLNPESRAFFEPRFGRSFGEVRVHTGAVSEQATQNINARAYTLGNHMVFGYGEYKPETEQGRRLIAHELTHVIQQGESGARIQRNPLDGEEATVSIPYQSGEISLSQGDAVEIVEWDAGDGMARVQLTAPHIHAYVPLSIPQLFLSARGRAQDQDEAGPHIIGELPIEFVAEPEQGTPLAMPGNPTAVMTSGGEEPEVTTPGWPGFLMTDLGLSLHHLAMGDMGFLPRSQAGFDFMMSRTYWDSFLPRADTTVLDRFVGTRRAPTFPGDYTPRIEAEAWRTGPLGRHALNLTEAELRALPDLLRRLNREGIGALTQRELQVLFKTADLHVGGVPSGSPWVSYAEPNPSTIRDLRWLVEGASETTPRYRIRVEMPSASALDLRGGAGTPLMQAIDDDALRQLLNNLPNPQEMEFLAASADDVRLRGVQAVTGAENATPGFLLRHGNKIRWGGRILFVAGLAYSGYRIGTATEEERPRVIGEEVGSQALGAAGAALAAAGCVAFGVATGGVGLFICGLVGGVAGGVGGQYLGGHMGEGISEGIEAIEWGLENDPAVFILPTMPTLRNYSRHGAAFPRVRSPYDVMMGR